MTVCTLRVHLYTALWQFEFLTSVESVQKFGELFSNYLIHIVFHNLWNTVKLCVCAA